MTLSIQGTGVSRGIAIGPLNIVQQDALEIPEYVLSNEYIDEEISRFRLALKSTKQQLRRVKEHIPDHTKSDIAAFIDTHVLMLKDSTIAQIPINIIKEKHYNAEWALQIQCDAIVKAFDEMNDPYLRTRRDDVIHIVKNIQQVLLNGAIHHNVSHTLEQRLSGHIIVTDELSPADTVLLQHQGIAGFVTEKGGPTSHTAILARSLQIPAIVGLHHARQLLKNNENIIIDGQRGLVIAEPSAKIIVHYHQRKRNEQRLKEIHSSNQHLATISEDKVSISLLSNIELPEDLASINEINSNGVGLYRTEFLFMNRNTLPDEEEQYKTYCNLLEQFNGKPVTIRTLDVGADKAIKQADYSATNPALGIRAIRLSLKKPELFLPQLRAILRASAHGDVRILLPMVTNFDEMQQILRHIVTAKDQLQQQQIDYNHSIQIGAMIEVPAAAMNAQMFSEHIDFLSIGTNDLIQYSLAIDRLDDEVNYLYDPLNPAVIKFIAMTIEAGQKANLPVSMCGEMASDPDYTKLLLGLGLRQFSIHPHAHNEIKHLILQSNVELLQMHTKILLATTSYSAYLAQLEVITQL